MDIIANHIVASCNRSLCTSSHVRIVIFHIWLKERDEDAEYCSQDGHSVL